MQIHRERLVNASVRMVRAVKLADDRALALAVSEVEVLLLGYGTLGLTRVLQYDFPTIGI